MLLSRFRLGASRRINNKGRQLAVSELRELRVLRDENKKLKQLVADLTLDKHIFLACTGGHDTLRIGRVDVVAGRKEAESRV